MKRGVTPALAHLETELGLLADAGLLRRPPAVHRRGKPSFCSNDYLGLADADPGDVPWGAGASRLVAGEHVEHGMLEAALGSWLGVEGTLLFTSGYAANVGLVPALAFSGDDLIVSDALNHASLVDGCRLARAKTVIAPHKDHEAVRALLRGSKAKRRWVLTESYFSMDADTPDLAALRGICDEYAAGLIVDEAHALGVLGPDGRGLLAASNVQADVVIGTLGKAFGGAGAFVGGCHALREWLWNRARSFVFSTGQSPRVAHAALTALERLRTGDDLRRATLERADQLRAGLQSLGHSPLGYGHVVPWLIGDSREASRVAASLREQGFPVEPIRPPSVAPGTARIRFTASASQRPEDVAELLHAIGKG